MGEHAGVKYRFTGVAEAMAAAREWKAAGYPELHTIRPSILSGCAFCSGALWDLTHQPRAFQRQVFNRNEAGGLDFAMVGHVFVARDPKRGRGEITRAAFARPGGENAKG